MSTRRSTAALVGASALFLSGCGGSSTSAPKPSGPVSTLPSFDSPQTTLSQSAAGAASVLPDLVVDDVGAGTKVNLASLVPSPEPILVWLWAPN